MPIPIKLLLGGWVLFWVYWLISAVSSKRNASRNIRRSIGIRIVILVLALVLIRVSDMNGRVFGDTYLVQNSPILVGIGLALFVAGLSVAIWARVHLGKNWGMPMSLKQDPELVTSGPYRFIRHPIYSGLLLAILGSALVDGVFWLIILVAAGVYFVYSAREEEKLMLRQFPKAYPAYQKRTKMLVPFLL